MRFLFGQIDNKECLIIRNIFQNKYLFLMIFIFIIFNQVKMIQRKTCSILFQSSFSYVSSKKIQQIKVQDTNAISKVIQIAMYICKQGYMDAKKDIKHFIKMRKEDRSQLQPQDNLDLERIKSDIFKIPPIAVMFWFPGGFPLILAYISLFPKLSPSWFQTDKYQEEMVKIQKSKQKEALKYFQDAGSIIIQNEYSVDVKFTLETLNNMNYRQVQLVSELCYGKAVEGSNIVEIIQSKFGSLISDETSKNLIIKSLKFYLSMMYPKVNLADAFLSRVRRVTMTI